MEYNRRLFIRQATLASIGATLASNLPFGSFANEPLQEQIRVGIIGLDTSHSVAFVKSLNAPVVQPQFAGFKVTAAYPYGSADIKSSVERIPGYTADVKKFGVEIVDSIAELLKKVDVVLLETNDGRLHLEQAKQVIKAGKRLFIDKPISASLKDAIAIFDLASAYNVPIFSSSSLRYTTGAQAIQNGSVGKVWGADAFSPMKLEKTHPDLFWYGIHGVEILFTVMGMGCRSVTRSSTADSDVIVGAWEDQRIGTFRGLHNGKQEYGGTVFGTKSVAQIGPYAGHDALLEKIIEFFKTGIPPVSAKETLEIYAFMEAADESKRRNGAPVTLEEVMGKAKR
ncbi:MAG: Gfo/Idh/MocA family oxidoreductase [Pedobacter sp.]|nr:Gfo/Idh/MocA family oxidoreductase [Pedobacter sp.]MDQ8052244.1 Gfo/Idh/MocA family oxidoreductase [Pedobacter sp.]